MKKINVLIVCTLLFFAVCFACANLLVANSESSEKAGRPYRVEINRIENIISKDGFSSLDLSEYRYVTAVYEFDALSDAAFSESDCVVREIGGKYYRFEYSYTEAGTGRIYLIVNGVLAVLTVFTLILLIYIKVKILKPFNRISSLPYELSKGNLTAPVNDTGGQYFGKFIWGIDLLRENIEQQKSRELELQRQKKTLLLSLSHDIKTPLSAIKLYSKAISTGLYDGIKTQNEIADSINSKADEIERYISKIIQTANEDLFNFDVNSGNFYLSSLVESIRGYYTEKLSLIHTEFTVLPYTDCMLNGDIDRGIEVLQNTIENAIKYGDGKKIALEISEEDGCILISVCNTGSIISENELPHIFDSFYRGSNTDGKPGNGLGLYICRQLMHKMNGEIFAEPQKDGMKITAVFPKA